MLAIAAARSAPIVIPDGSLEDGVEARLPEAAAGAGEGVAGTIGVDELVCAGAAGGAGVEATAAGAGVAGGAFEVDAAAAGAAFGYKSQTLNPYMNQNDQPSRPCRR